MKRLAFPIGFAKTQSQKISVALTQLQTGAVSMGTPYLSTHQPNTQQGTFESWIPQLLRSLSKMDRYGSFPSRQTLQVPLRDECVGAGRAEAATLRVQQCKGPLLPPTQAALVPWASHILIT